MKKKLFSFFGILAVLFISQSAWAAAGDKTTTSASWSQGDFSGTISSQKSTVTTPDGFASFVVSGDKGIKYDDSYHAIWTYRDPRLNFGSLERHESINGNIVAVQLGTGYTFNWTSLYVDAACCGADGHFYLGHEESVSLLNNRYKRVSRATTTNFMGYNDTVPFYFHRSGISVETYPAWIVEYGVNYQIIPNTPSWNKVEDNMNVTVDNINGQYYYDLTSNLTVANSAFAGSVKYELVSNNAQYVFWNGDHTAFYVLKSGDYKVKAYIEKVDGKYCSSAYTTEFTLHATVKAEDIDNAKIYFYLDGFLAEETDIQNRFWDAALSSIETDAHYVEYVSGLNVNMYPMTITLTERHLTDEKDDELAADHFVLNGTIGKDTIKVMQNGKMNHLIITVNSDGSNHLPYAVDNETQFNNSRIVTHTDNVVWDESHKDIKFNSIAADQDVSKTRTIEFAFTGVPDSVFFGYNTNAERNRDNVRLKVSYAVSPGNWVEIASVSAPASSDAAYDKTCAYAVPANAKYIQLQYYNAQYSGWVRNFTITERKQVTLDTPLADTITFVGRHTIGGKVTHTAKLSWYNLAPELQWTRNTNTPDSAMFNINSSAISVAQDKYQENIPFAIDFKLDSIGTFTTNLMIWSADKPVVIGGNTYYCTLQGIVGYNAEEVVVENTLPTDTATVVPGQPIDNPFVVKDTAGNVITDSLDYEFSFLPEGSAHVDENGKIVPDCVGYIRVAASLKENKLIPGGLKDSVWLFVPETSKNVVKWMTFGEIGKGDILPKTMASTEDGAEMTYEFIPANYAQTVEGGFEMLVADSVQVVAKAAQTCAHFAINDTVALMVRGIVTPENMAVNQSIDVNNIQVLDTLKDLIIVKGENGDTLRAPEVNITYVVDPSDYAHFDENGNLIIDKAGDVKITATVTGDTIKTIVKEFDLNLKPVDEVIYMNIPDTLLLSYAYDFKNVYTSTLSKLGIDSIYVLESYENMLTIEDYTVTPKQKGEVRIFMIAKGNEDFIGPVKVMKEVTIVAAVKDIPWEEQLKEDLEEPRVGDTIHTGDVPVYDEEGHIVPDAERTYEIIPEGAAHVTPEGDVVVDLPIDPITVVVTTEKEGMETKVDTIIISAKPASIGEVELPEDLLDGDVHVGDTISLKDVKVYDQNGKDITDQMDKIEFIIEPEEAAHFEKVGKDSVLVIDKDMPFEIITKVTDPMIDPELATDTTKVEVETYNVGEVVMPEDVQKGELQPGETIDTDDIRVLDKDGKDITDLCEKTYTFIPADAAHIGEDGQIVIDKAGDIAIITHIEGEGIEPIDKTTQIHVDKFVPEDESSFELPEPEHENGYQIGDELPIVLKDKDGKDITDFADINVTIDPADKAHFDPEKNVLVLDQEGPADFTITVGGDNVEPYTYNESIYIHHDEAGCYDYMVQLWNDVAIVNNNNETASFVRYEWYKNGQLVEGQNGQDYHEANGAAMNGVYYAYAYDAAGNKYMICEQEFNGTASAAPARALKVYPTMVNTSNLYTIETEIAGEVFISTSNGSAAQRFTVEAGKNNVHAPFAQGVYMLRFVANDGQSAMQKLIVK